MVMPNPSLQIGKINFNFWDLIKICGAVIGFVCFYTNIDKQLALIQQEVAQLRQEVQDFKANYVTINERVNDLDKRVTVLEKDYD
jgi:phosphoglycerate-specific signal transduction histidine kinase